MAKIKDDEKDIIVEENGDENGKEEKVLDPEKVVMEVLVDKVIEEDFEVV